MIYPVIKGANESANGGGSSHTPVEAKESGRSRQQLDIVEVISEGEIHGLVNDMKSIYLDKTPVANPDGTFNFKNLSFQARLGTQNQSPMNGFNTAQREIAVGVEVKQGKPITKTVTDKNVTSLRITVGVKSLVQHEENGDTNGSSVDLQIRIGNKVYLHNFTGKYTAGAYLEMLEIYDLPTPPFNITVSRLTPDSTSQRLQNGTLWASYTEITSDNFAYPNTALVGVSIDSDYFQSQPQRNYLIRGLIVNVPDIYNPFTRTYSSDFWNGTFKKAWTNNPVWIWYDLVTNKRYGLGKSIADFNVDVFQLFAISKYCDELVPDGFGGKEPRMTCNAWITDQREAYYLIQSLSSVFRAMPIWNGQYLTAVQDRVADPVWTYNNSNVVEGVFTYSRSARKARHNTIQVEWVNPDDFYNVAIEQVTDDESVKRFGQNISKVTAFGCTSRGQAYRTGRWILETEKLETETVTFTVGAEGLMHLPYDIIEVADNQFAGTNVGGRVLSAIANKVELDRPIEFDSKTYLSYINKRGEFKRTKVMGFDKKTNTVTLDQAVGDIQELAVWSLETSKVATGLYRCTAIVENEDGTFNITALQHVPQKEDIVINGTHFDPKPRTVYSALENITVDYDGRKAVIKGHVNNLDNTGNEEITYDIRILKNGAVFSNKLGLKSPSYSVEDLENGEYTVIITAKDKFGRIISVKEYNFVIDKPPLVANPSAVGGLGCIYLTWDYINDITDTEIWASRTDNLSTAKLIARVNSVMFTFECEGNETWYFWLRHVRGVNVGSFGQATGIQATSAESLDDLKQLQSKIAEQVVNVALPARKLELTKTVPSLADPTQYQGAKQIYVEDVVKLMIWNGHKYESPITEIRAEKIVGKLSQTQLDNALVSQITNTAQTSNDTKRKLEQEIKDRQSAITDIKKSQVNRSEVATIAQSALQSVWRKDLSNEVSKIAIGGRNLIRNSGTPITSSDYGQRYAITEAPAVGDDVIVTLYGEVGTDRTGIGVYNSRGYGEILTLEKISDGVYQGKGKWKLPTGGTNEGEYADNTHLNVYFYPKTANSNYTINKIKFERGTVATDWSPAPEDVKKTNEDLIARVTREENARTTSESALSERINGVDTKIGGVQGQVTTISRTVTDVKGRIETTHTIKTQAIAGNKTAIAGIALGATEKESSVIVMADKFQVVKNANDGNPTRLFSVQGNKTVINGELIATGGIKAVHIQANSITGDKIATNAIQTGNIQAGAIRANHIASDQITADKLAIGLGGNLLPNPLFTGNSEGWYGFVSHPEQLGMYWSAGSVGVQYENLRYDPNHDYRPQDSQYKNETFSFSKWSVANYSQLSVDSKSNKWWVDNARVLVNVIPDKTYIFSAYVGCHHCGGYLIAEEYSSDGKNYLGWINNSRLFGERNRIHLNAGEEMDEASSSHFAKGVDTTKAHRAFVKFKAPKSGVVCLIFRIARFGHSQAYQDNYMARAMLEQVEASQNVPSKWRETSITAIDGGSIVANTISGDKIRANSIIGDKIVGNTIAGDKLVANSITGDKIAGNTITGDKIQANSITGNHITGNTITGDKIVARSISSDKLNVGSLSAISSNIGRINAGDITGVNIHGNNINGNNISGGSISATTIHGTDINGGTIRGARLEGVTGKFTGSLEVNQLIGGNLCEVFVARVYETVGFWQSQINIAASPVKRVFFIVNSHKSFTVEANQSYRYLYTNHDKKMPPEFFDIGGGNPKICITAYAVSNTTTMSQ